MSAKSPPAQLGAAPRLVTLRGSELDGRLEGLLEQAGYALEYADSQADLLAALPQSPSTTLVLLCHSNGQLDTMDVCRHIKNHPRTHLTPVVMLIPAGQTKLRRQAIRAGADECLAMPGSADELLWRLRHRFDHTRITDSLDQAEGVILSLARAIEAKDDFTDGHVERVACYAAQIGHRLGLEAEEIRTLRQSGIVHDLGKIAVPDGILNRKGPLDDDEWRIVRRHPTVGYELLEPLGTFAPCLPCVRWHHECLDGTGYPDGLIGDAIPLAARILAVADRFDAITSTRPYRKALSANRAFDILIGEADEGKIDPALVDVLAETYPAELVALAG